MAFGSTWAARTLERSSTSSTRLTAPKSSGAAPVAAFSLCAVLGTVAFQPAPFGVSPEYIHGGRSAQTISLPGCMGNLPPLVGVLPTKRAKAALLHLPLCKN